jgi:deoxyinosine 3'endonuclease (endonuclease V)
VSLETALERVARCLTRYRLPEPIRIADRLSRSGASRR